MASCAITAGITSPACADKFFTPGVQVSNIYMANYKEIASFSESGNEISAISFDTYKGLYQLEIHPDSGEPSEELTTGGQAGSYYTQTFEARIMNTDSTTIGIIEDMVDTPLVLLTKTKKGDWLLLGRDGGITMSANTKKVGKTAGDEVGDMLTFTGVNNGKMSLFFDTDAATTQALIESYVL